MWHAPQISTLGLLGFRTRTRTFVLHLVRFLVKNGIVNPRQVDHPLSFACLCSGHVLALTESWLLDRSRDLDNTAPEDFLPGKFSAQFPVLSSLCSAPCAGACK
jgi:hypothetical protein